jgi:hypothetical protein
MHFKPPIVITLLLLFGCQLICADSVQACPTCKDGLANGTAFGYAFSILLMMGMPFAIFSFWAVTIVRLRAKAASMSDSDWQTIQSS